MGIGSSASSGSDSDPLLNASVTTPGYASPYPMAGVAASTNTGDPQLDAFCRRLVEIQGLVAETVRMERKAGDKSKGRGDD
jgi:hypothetical protein